MRLFLNLNFAAYLLVPPPITSPHLAIFPIAVICIAIDPNRFVVLLIFEGGILHQLPNTFHRITMPEFYVLYKWLPIIIVFIPCNPKRGACPLWSIGKTIDTLQQCASVVE